MSEDIEDRLQVLKDKIEELNDRIDVLEDEVDSTNSNREYPPIFGDFN